MTTTPRSWTTSSRPIGIGWSWPRLLHQLGVGPSAVSMLALPYLHRYPSGRTPSQPGRRAAS